MELHEGLGARQGVHGLHRVQELAGGHKRPSPAARAPGLRMAGRISLLERNML